MDKRGWVQKELRKALELLDEWPPGTIFVIPVRLDDSKPRHPMLQRLHWIDLFQDYDAGVRRLITAIGIADRAPHVARSVEPNPLASHPGVPHDVLAPIVSRAQRLGSDLKARAAYVQRELDAWLHISLFQDPDVPSHVQQQIRENLAYLCPESMSERKLMLAREVLGWKILQQLSLTAGSLVQEAVSLWPRSFAAQYYCVVARQRDLQDAF